jgi:putative membrane protein
MQRSLKDYLIISLKGIAMGAADVVPGVSGGTIAFISGIYEELIDTINRFNLKALKVLKENGFKKAFDYVNGKFILSLLLGIGISVFSLARLFKWLIETHPILIWSFFFGLVLASIFFVGKQIKKWDFLTIINLILGAVIAYYITTMPAMENHNQDWFLVLAGALAICAMILPGISGAFILLLLGVYKPALEAIHNFDLKKIALLAFGAIVGLLSFARILKWLFKHYPNRTLAVLTGFIIGSLNKIWPWKEPLTWYTNSKGIKLPLTERSVSPFAVENNQLILAILLAVIGFSLIFFLEKLGNNKNSINE